jgi:hypothetical protein
MDVKDVKAQMEKVCAVCVCVCMCVCVCVCVCVCLFVCLFVLVDGPNVGVSV